MKINAIQGHLKPNAIQHRLSVALEFAHAMLPHEAYDEPTVRAAVIALGTDPDDLTCTYCGAEANTWDHLVGLVEGREPRGPGNQLCNLVPCCRNCNAAKGRGEWRTFVHDSIRIADDRRVGVEERIDRHVQIHIGATFNLDESFFLEARELRRIRNLVIQFLIEAQTLALELREKQQRLLWPTTASTHAVAKAKAVEAGRRAIGNDLAPEDGGREADDVDDAYQAFYELVFDMMATDPGRARPGPRSCQRLRSGAWGAFWIHFMADDLVVCAYLQAVGGDRDARLARNKATFDRLLEDATEIQGVLGPDRPLRWERLDGRIVSRVGLAIPRPDLRQAGVLDATVAWAADALDRLVDLLEPPLDAFSRRLQR